MKQDTETDRFKTFNQTANFTSHRKFHVMKMPRYYSHAETFSYLVHLMTEHFLAFSLHGIFNGK